MKLYQIAPDAASLCMGYIIRTDGGHIIVIDGGRLCSDKYAPAYIPAAIRAIQGLGDGDFFSVDMWFLTHAHRDHISELSRTLASCGSFEIKNILFDFPEMGVEWQTSGAPADCETDAIEDLKRALDIYGAAHPESGFSYDALNGRYINAETVKNKLCFSIDGVRIRVLQTWDSADYMVNSNSLVMKLEANGKSVLFLGDTFSDSCERLLENCPAETLKSDYVQLAHHGQRGATQAFYDAIDAKGSVRLWPVPDWVWNVCSHPSLETDRTRTWMGLPADPAAFEPSARDIVACLYGRYPEEPEKAESWTYEVLSRQLAADLR